MKLSKSITCLVSSIALLGTLAACSENGSSSTSEPGGSTIEE